MLVFLNIALHLAIISSYKQLTLLRTLSNLATSQRSLNNIQNTGFSICDDKRAFVPLSQFYPFSCRLPFFFFMSITQGSTRLCTRRSLNDYFDFALALEVSPIYPLWFAKCLFMATFPAPAARLWPLCRCAISVADAVPWINSWLCECVNTGERHGRQQIW